MTGAVFVLLLFYIDSYTLADCTNRRIDLALIVDASGSVTIGNFIKQLKFMKNLISEADIDGGVVRVATVVFSSNARVEFHLNTHLTREGVQDAIGNISYDDRGTNIALGLRLTRTDVFTAAGGDRDDADNVAILITDGYGHTMEEAQTLKKTGTRLVVVTILGNSQSFKDVASQPAAENIFASGDFDGLEALRSSILGSICEQVNPCQRVPRPPTANRFSFDLTSLNRDFPKGVAVIFERPGQNLTDCVLHCTGNPQCVAFVIHSDGLCRLSTSWCNATDMTTATSSKVYILNMKGISKN